MSSLHNSLVWNSLNASTCCSHALHNMQIDIYLLFGHSNGTAKNIFSFWQNNCSFSTTQVNILFPLNRNKKIVNNILISDIVPICLRYRLSSNTFEQPVAIHSVLKSYFLNIENNECLDFLLELFTANRSNEFSLKIYMHAY